MKSNQSSVRTQQLPDPYGNLHQQSLRPPTVILMPSQEFHSSSRKWQGIASLECTHEGKLVATWYSGGSGEGVGNYVIVQTSCDQGISWSQPLLALQPPEQCRCFDPLPWVDPQGRLWLFWGQASSGHNGRDGVWYIRCDNPDRDACVWSKPARICDGVMMNKPTVLRNGDWLLPVTLWGANLMGPMLPELSDWYYPHVIATADHGEHWTFRGKADLPQQIRSCDENMIVEHRDASLSMFIRTRWGIGLSTSTDGGIHWTFCKPSGLPGVDSRFFIRRCKSGRLLLITHNDITMRRTNLTAYISEDDGQTWSSGLLLDARFPISYPDGAEDGKGNWYIIYDHGRNDAYWPGDGEIVMASFTEEDVLAGEIISPASRLQILIDRLPIKSAHKFKG